MKITGNKELGLLEIKKPKKLYSLADTCCHIIRDESIKIGTVLYDIKNGLGFEFDKKKTKSKTTAGLLNFIKNNDYETYKKYILLNLIDRLINDFLHYTYFGLKAIAPTHNQVAYTLFRKPYQENLSYIEQLVLNPNTFLDKFCKNNIDIKELDKFLKEKLPQKNTAGKDIRIIKTRKDKNLFDLVKLIGLPFSAKVIHNARLNDKKTGGLYQKSIHLITSSPTHKTESENLNFIFLNQDSNLAEEHSKLLYHNNLVVLPYAYFIFYLALKIIAEQVYNNQEIPKSLFEKINNYHFLKIYSASLIGLKSLNKKPTSKTIIDLINILAIKFDVKCNKCEKHFQFDEYKLVKDFAMNGLYGCENCYHFQHCSEDLILSKASSLILKEKLAITRNLYSEVREKIEIEQGMKDTIFPDIYSMKSEEFSLHIENLKINDKKLSNEFIEQIKKLRRLKLYAYRDTFFNY